MTNKPGFSMMRMHSGFYLLIACLFILVAGCEKPKITPSGPEPTTPGTDITATTTTAATPEPVSSTPVTIESVDVSVEGTTLTTTIQVSAPEPSLQYAFYVIRDKETILKHPYQAENTFKYNAEQPGTYLVTGFVRRKGESEVYKNSAPVTVGEAAPAPAGTQGTDQTLTGSEPQAAQEAAPATSEGQQPAGMDQQGAGTESQAAGTDQKASGTDQQPADEEKQATDSETSAKKAEEKTSGKTKKSNGTSKKRPSKKSQD